jgi:hypothetical protein
MLTLGKNSEETTMADSTSRIDLNSADVALLTQLPGVAKNVAYEIVNYRKQHGGFSGWEDLQNIRSLPKDKQTLGALQEAAFLGPRAPATPENPRRVLTRRLGKSKDELHNHG